MRTEALSHLLRQRVPAPAKKESESDPRGRVAEIYEAHADFVWKTLARMGVAEADRLDLTQEVFVVVQRRLHTLRADVKPTTWLFGICRRIASNERKRAFRSREVGSDAICEFESEAPLADEVVGRRQAQAALQTALQKLDVEQRAVFVMFEVDGLSCREIASSTGLPLGTVFSRLRLARRRVERAISALRAKEARIR